MKKKNVIVVGAGLAGLSCAFELASCGLNVQVLEAKSVLGGRTSSWIDEGMPVESGLHKFLGIYRALPDLLERAGVDLDQMLTWVDELAYLVPGGPDGCFTVSPFHRPVSTAKTALGNTEFLPTSEKVKLAAMSAAGAAKCVSDPLELDRISIAKYAASYGVSAEILERVVSTGTQAILFLSADEFSAYAAISPLVEGIKHGMTMRIGAFNGGMTEVMIEPIAQWIVEMGGTIRRGIPVSNLIVDKGRVRGVRVGGEELKADNVVVATSLKPAQELLGAHFSTHEWFEPMLRLPSLSAATIQFELDQPVLDSDRTNFSPTSLCCFAEQSRTTFRRATGRFSAILYPPDKFLDMAPDKVVEEVYRSADLLNLPLRGHVLRYRIVNHPFDFYAMRPGTEPMRPEQQTSVPGLYLAGDYTKQPFTATMEGAVISGRLAAEAVLA
jgi:15-cis-phytoene desaturase